MASYDPYDQPGAEVFPLMEGPGRCSIRLAMTSTEGYVGMVIAHTKGVLKIARVSLFR